MVETAGGASGPIAAFFDLDKTVIATSSVLAFSPSFRSAQLITRRTLLRSAYGQLVFMLHGADHQQMEQMRVYLSTLCRGWDVRAVREIVADTLEHVVRPLVYREAVELIDSHHDLGHDVAIVSASGAEVVGPIGELLGADQVLATEMVIDDGRYTGEIARYCYGPGKADAIAELARSQGYDLARCFAYSDSITDVPMLELVGHPIVVNPDKALRREAIERGWPVRDFVRPVGLRDRRRVSAPAALGAGAAIGVGALAVYAARRYRA